MLTPARAAAQSGARPLRVEITGISGAEQRNALAVLTIARDTKKGTYTLAQVRRMDQRATGEIETALQPFGFYRPTVIHSVAAAGNRWLARYTIAPGPAVRVRTMSITLTGAGADAGIFREAVRKFPLQQGDTLRHLPYEAWKLALLTVASDSGYLQATFDTTALNVNRETSVADILVRFDTGPRFRFGAVTFNQDILDPSFLATRIPFRRGQPFQQQKLLQLQTSLGEDPYFNMVEVIPRPDSATNLEVPIEVDLAARRPQAYELGLGYATDNGPRGRALATFRWLNRKGHHAEVEVIAAFNQQSISGKYFIPAFGNPTGVLTLIAGYGLLNPNQQNSSRTFIVGPQLSRRRFGWRETFNLNYQRTSFGVGVDSGVVKLLLGGVTYERTRSDSRIFPSSGLHTRIDITGASRGLASTVSFVHTEVNGKVIVSPTARWRVLARADVGRVFTNELRSLPPVYRFFAGGDQSVRGYRYLSLGPRDSLGTVIGGRSLLVGSLETDYQFINRFAVAVFVDAGNAMDTFTLSDLKEGAGAGIRWVSPIGLIRLDGAFALSTAGTPFRLHFSLGPDL